MNSAGLWPNTLTMVLVGISGKVGAGKDTVKDLILQLDHHRGGERKWHTLRFADRLKHVVAVLTGTTVQDNYTRDGKQIVPPGFDKSLGTLQQLVGMAMRTHIDPDIWVKVTLAPVLEKGTSENFIISDVRFKNEARAIREMGGILIRVNGDPTGVRRGPNVDSRDLNHISETDLDDYQFDVVMDNTGTLDELKTQVENFLNDGL